MTEPSPIAVRISSVLRPSLLFVVTLLVAAPMIAVTASLFSGGAGVGDTQAHIWSTTGPRYLWGTLLLCLLAGGGAGVIGATAAFIITLTTFPGRRVLSILLAAPLAVPAYIAAYVYGDLFSPFGAGSQLFARLGLPAPPVRSFAGAAFVLALTTYPYVYVAMRAAMEARSGVLMEVARSLGARPVTALTRILFPLTRTAFAGGLALCLMEIAGEFGVAEYFGVPTLSTGIFRVWRGLGDVTAAAQLAAGLFLIAIMLVWLEKTARKGRVDDSARGGRKAKRITLGPLMATLAMVICVTPIIFGIGVPVGALLLMAIADQSALVTGPVLNVFVSTIILAATGAATAVSLGAIIVLFLTRQGRQWNGLSSPPVGVHQRLLAQVQMFAHRIAVMGYALPGALIAMGILQLISVLPEAWRGGVIATSGGVLLIYAYTVRFLTIAHNNIAAGAAQISPAFRDAARNLGAGSFTTARRIEIPLIYRSICAGGAVIFVDIAKELPATLILRPFGLETLATSVYRLASDERLADASWSALALIGLSVIPIIGLVVLEAGPDQQKPRRRSIANLIRQTTLSRSRLNNPANEHQTARSS